MTPFQERVRAFVAARVLGRERGLDSGALPRGLHAAFRRAGLANWWLDRRHGGAGLSLEESVGVVEELAYGDAGLAASWFISIVATTLLELYGTPSQRRRFLAPLGRRGGFAATLFSEPGGSELYRTAATARREGGAYVLDGAKLFSTNTADAEFLAVLARASDAMPPLQFFLVPRRTPGVKIIRRWRTMGLRASGLYEVRLERCRVPADSRLGPSGAIALIGLNASRTLIAAGAVGVARRARDAALAFARERDLGPDKLSRSPVFAAKLGQLEAEIEAMRTLCLTAARDFDAVRASPRAGERFLDLGALKSVLVAKMLCGQLGWKAVSEASLLLGGRGYTEDCLMSKLLRDMRAVSIIEQGDEAVRGALYGAHVLPAAGGAAVAAS